jgi:hypothetical protein
MASFIRMRLYNLPDSRPSKRLQSNSVWLESARVSTSIVALRFCCSWSPIFADVTLDVVSGYVFSTSLQLAGLCDRINLSKKELRDSPALLSSIVREVEASANEIWPLHGNNAWSPKQRPIIEHHALDALRAFTSLPSLFGSNNQTDDYSNDQLYNESLQSSSAVSSNQLRIRLSAVLDGLALSISLIVTALNNSRRTVVAKPLPFWLTTMSSTSSTALNGSHFRSGNNSSEEFDGGNAPHAQVFDFDADVLEKALNGLGPLTDLFVIDSTNTKIEYNNDNLSRLSLDSILLLYWLLCLAPTHLVRLPKPTAEGATASYSVLHGFRDLHVPFHEDDSVLWDESAFNKYGRYRMTSGSGTEQQAKSASTFSSNSNVSSSTPRWFHGTAGTNAHCILSFGLRTLSGTRHESTGGMYGDGVYLSNSLSVARNFAKAVGFDWSGFSLINGGIAASKLLSSKTAAMNNTRNVSESTLLVVFEVDLVAAPGNKIMVEGRDIREEAEQRGIPQNAGYVVVPDASHLWISALHAFSDETKVRLESREEREKSSICGGMTTCLVVVIVFLTFFWFAQRHTPNHH